MIKYPDTAVLLAGHGSSKTNRQSRPAREQAALLQDQSLFGTVQTAFFKEAPLLKEALPPLQEYHKVIIVPLLMCRGFISQVVIPREMGLKDHTGPQEVIQAAPVGEHPSLVALIRERITTHLQDHAIKAHDLSVFLVAHGNSKPDRPASRHHAQTLALRVAQDCPIGAILPAFIEEDPLLTQWESRVQTPHVLVIPLMMAAGTHSQLDIPKMIGLQQSEASLKALHEDGIAQGPFLVSRRSIWLTQAIGSHPKMVEVIRTTVEDYLRTSK